METGTVVDHPQQGCPCIIRTRRLVQTVAAGIQWDPVKKQSVVAWELNISKMFMSGVLRSDLGLKARAIKSKCLFEHYADSGERRISFHRWKYLQYWGGFQSGNWTSLCLDILRNSWQGSRETIILLLSWFCWGVSYDATTSSISVKRGENLCQSLWEHSVGACCEAF